MNEMPRFTGWTMIALLVVLSCAGGARVWYLNACTDNGEHAGPLQVQGPSPRSEIRENALRGRTPPTQLEELVANLTERQEFACRAPLSAKEEPTAHIAPGYPLLFSAFVRWGGESAATWMRWLQCALGSLTAVCFFFFARRAFHNTAIATLTGLLCAFHPFWIINTAELNDGMLVTFLVGASLALGARGGQVGGGVTGFLFGLALAGVALTRAALLPFAVVSLLWFLWECRRIPLGWFAAFLALVGFANGLAPWCIRNYSVFDEPVPVVTSMYLHLWIGNNPLATGSTLDEATLRNSIAEDRLKALLDEPNQARRYRSLADEVREEIENHPTETMSRRIDAALIFFFSERWFKERHLGLMQQQPDGGTAPPEWITEHRETILLGTLLGMFALALLGWRMSHPWRRYGRLATIAALCIPLPYVLSHAEYLSGPRLPLDGVLLCYAAFALASFVPRLVGTPAENRT